MARIPVTFVISALTEREVDLLNEGYEIISKMILTPEDDKLFRYEVNDRIQVETQNGRRLWCSIRQLEKVVTDERVVLMFTLVRHK